MPPLPKLYTSLAPWFHLLTAPADYAYEAARFRQLLTDACDGTLRTMLELGSGGGNSAWHLKAHFAMTLVDLSPEMLELSRTINPECEHIAGDMRSVRLGREFDAVFVHDAVMYMTTEDDLRGAMETAFAHTRPGGAALFVPDCVGETFAPRTKHGGHDGVDGRSLRYLEWTYDPDPNDTSYIVDFAILLREADGSIRVEHDRHEFGIFSRLDWLRLLGEAGFRTKSVKSDNPELAGEVFVAVKPLE